MRIKYHYAAPARPKLISFLEKYEVSYEIYPVPGVDNSFCAFDLYKDQEIFHRFIMEFPFLNNNKITEAIEYSKYEINNSAWLFVRSKSRKVEWKYTSVAFQLSCCYKKMLCRDNLFKHSEQVKPLTVTKSMKWSKRLYFSGPNAADDFIFCSKRAKDMLEGKWAGLDFLDVIDTKNEPYDNLYQLLFARKLPLKALHGGKQTTCSTCGRPIFRLKNALLQLKIREQFLPDADSVYTTGSVLADSIMGFPTYELNIVPQSFYQYCEDKGMNHGMIYEPVNLI